MYIDSHQHYWQISRDDYQWMKDNPGVDPIRKDYFPAQLDELRAGCNISKTVVVQAAATNAETDFLLQLADDNESIAMVVGWIDFEDSSQTEQLQRWAEHGKFSGVRPMIQDIADDQWMHRADVQWAYQNLIDLDLTFDALGFPQHMEPFLRLLDRYSSMRVVLDHALKPEIRNGELKSWAEKMRLLARNTNASCKVSGMLTEAKPGATLDDLRPYLDVLFAEFSLDRLMFGSDWPVLELVNTYPKWFEMMQQYVTDEADRDKVFRSSAASFYRITDA